MPADDVLQEFLDIDEERDPFSFDEENQAFNKDLEMVKKEKAELIMKDTFLHIKNIRGLKVSYWLEDDLVFSCCIITTTVSTVLQDVSCRQRVQDKTDFVVSKHQPLDGEMKIELNPEMGKHLGHILMVCTAFILYYHIILCYYYIYIFLYYPTSSGYGYLH